MTKKEFRQRIRDKVHDWPLSGILRKDLSASDTNVNVSDGVLYRVGGVLKIDNERLFTVSIAGNDLIVRRAYKETIAAIHTAEAAIAIESFFSDDYINQEITNAYNAIFPSIYQVIRDTSLTLADVWKYDLSSLEVPIDRVQGLSQVEISDDTYADLWRNKTDWLHVGDVLEFLSKPEYNDRSIRLTYVSPYSAPDDDTTDTYLPAEYHELIEQYVISRLQESRLQLKAKFEEYSDKSDIGAVTAGDIMGISGFSMYQFTLMLERLTIPSLPIRRHVRRG